MLKPYHYGIFLLCAAFSNNVLAANDCRGTNRVNNSSTPTLADTLAGNTVCGTESGGAAFQEEHRTSLAAGGGNFFELWDYKKGASDPTDPTSIIGKWKLYNSDNFVRYIYGSNTFNYTVHTTGDGIYHFCTGNNTTSIVSAIIVGGLGGCGFPP